MSCAIAAFVVLAGVLAGAREVPITILQTTDLHGHVLPWGGGGGNASAAGLLRCASLIQNIREQEANVIYVDCGDLIQGGAESWLTGGRIMVKAMEWLKLDAWVLGNHDFDWGVDALASLHDRTSLALLGANVGVVPGVPNRLGKVAPFVVKEVDGVRVALVGLTTPAIPTWLLPDTLGDVRFERSAEALSRIMPAVRSAHPDVMVLLVHQGYQALGDDTANEVNGLARSFPEFDVMLGGHLHAPLAGVRLNDVLYGQAGCYGNGVVRADLVFDTVARRVVEKTAEVIPVTDRHEPCEPLRALLREDLDRAEAYLAEELGRTEKGLTAAAAGLGLSPVQRLVSAAIGEEAKADVVLHGALSEAGLPAGAIRRGDVWRLVPYENRIGVVWLTVEEIREILEENTDLIGSVHFLGAYGLSYEYHPRARPGRRIRNICLPDGTTLHARKRVRVATSSYVLASGGGRFPGFRRIANLPTSRLEMTDVDTRSAVVKYVKGHRLLQVPAAGSVRVVRRE
ncbi:MAG: bifunctional UDP-sugar hydrolase/5'-nucleotidase [Verrucomicrobiota bacterium]